MDMFGDLPEPSNTDHSKVGESRNRTMQSSDLSANNLFSDLPSEKGSNNTSNAKINRTPQNSGNNDLFGDLPSETKSADINTSESEEHCHKGEKRKLDDGSMADNGSHKRLQPGIYNLKSYFAERQGEREDMQDAHVMIDDFTPQVQRLHSSISRLAYYGVFDGHGGARASRFAADNLHKNVSEKFPTGDLQQVEKEIKKTFTDSFKKTDDEFLRMATKSKPSWKDGTTAVSTLVINNTLYIANLGDSKAMVCRFNEDKKSHVAIPLTKDHSPSQYEERMRIQKAGGHVKDGRVMGILEVSRSIGDGPYKAHGVTCIPDVKRCQLTKNDRYILLACDGLWKTFKPEETVEFVNKILTDGSIQRTELKSQEDVQYETACNKLASEAVRKLSADNVTVVIVRIKH